MVLVLAVFRLGIQGISLRTMQLLGRGGDGCHAPLTSFDLFPIEPQIT